MTSPGMRVTIDAPNLVACRRRNLLVAAWFGPPTTAEIHELDRALTQLVATEPVAPAVVILLGRGVTHPDAAGRAAIAALYRTHRASVVAWAIVFGQGHRFAAPLKAVGMAMTAALRLGSTQRYFDAVLPAAHWISERAAAIGGGFEPLEVVDLIVAAEDRYARTRAA